MGNFTYSYNLVMDVLMEVNRPHHLGKGTCLRLKKTKKKNIIILLGINQIGNGGAYVDD